MPPNYPNIAKFETGRTNRITIPTSVCPDWFQSGVEMFFVPLFWKDDLRVSEVRQLEAMLVCTEQMASTTDEWYINPLKHFVDSDDIPEEPVEEVTFVFKTVMTENHRQFKIICPPMTKGLCDEQGRLYVMRHPLGITIWSPPAFNEQFSR